MTTSSWYRGPIAPGTRFSIEKTARQAFGIQGPQGSPCHTPDDVTGLVEDQVGTYVVLRLDPSPSRTEIYVKRLEDDRLFIFGETKTRNVGVKFTQPSNRAEEKEDMDTFPKQPSSAFDLWRQQLTVKAEEAGRLLSQGPSPSAKQTLRSLNMHLQLGWALALERSKAAPTSTIASSEIANREPLLNDPPRPEPPPTPPEPWWKQDDRYAFFLRAARDTLGKLMLKERGLQHDLSVSDLLAKSTATNTLQGTSSSPLTDQLTSMKTELECLSPWNLLRVIRERAEVYSPRGIDIRPLPSTSDWDPESEPFAFASWIANLIGYPYVHARGDSYNLSHLIAGLEHVLGLDEGAWSLQDERLRMAAQISGVLFTPAQIRVIRELKPDTAEPAPLS